MAYTVGRFGPQALGNLRRADRDLLSHVHHFCGGRTRDYCSDFLAVFSIFKFVGYIVGELLHFVAGHEFIPRGVLPQLMEKLRTTRLFQARRWARRPDRLCVQSRWHEYLHDTGDTFFCAGAERASDLGRQLTTLLVAMLTSKGASGITGAGFITLAATLAAVRPELVPGMAIVLGTTSL